MLRFNARRLRTNDRRASRRLGIVRVDGVDHHALQLVAFDPRRLVDFDAHAPRRGRALRAPQRAERRGVADRVSLRNPAGEPTEIVL